MTLCIANVIEEGKLGGPQVRMVRVAKALEGRAETLIVMPRANSGRFREMCELHGVRWRALPLSRITKEWRTALAYLLFSPVEVVRLARLFRREAVDLVHASGGSWQIKGVVAARLAGIPAIWHLNDTSMPGWVRLLFRIVRPLASGFIFASDRSRAYYGGLIGQGRPESTIPATVNTTLFDPTEDFAGDEATIASFGDAPVIGTVANVTPIKGLETLIRAGALLRRKYPGLRVAVVGAVHANQRRYGQHLAQIAAEQGLTVDWLGARSDVRPLLRRFDVYVCSSVAESSPVSVWEAMAMARPIVATDVGDVARHVGDGQGGFIVPVGDAEAMAERIGRLLDDGSLCAGMGRVAREAAKAFAPEGVAADTLDLYERVIDRQAGNASSKAGNSRRGRNQ